MREAREAADAASAVEDRRAERRAGRREQRARRAAVEADRRERPRLVSRGRRGRASPVARRSRSKARVRVGSRRARARQVGSRSPVARARQRRPGVVLAQIEEAEARASRRSREARRSPERPRPQPLGLRAGAHRHALGVEPLVRGTSDDPSTVHKDIADVARLRTRRRGVRRHRLRARRAHRRGARRRGRRVFPARFDPIAPSTPRARAPSMVASRKARRAVTDPTPERTLARSAAWRSSRHGSRLLLQGGPSAPRASRTPRRSSIAIGAIPEPSLRLALGQWTTRVPARASPRASASRSCTPCASTARGPETPQRARTATSSSPKLRRTSARSSRCSAAWVWTISPASRARSTAPRTSRSLQLSKKRGAHA